MNTEIIRRLSTMVLLGLSLGGIVQVAAGSQQEAALGLVAQTSGGRIGDAAAAQGSSIYSGDYLSTSDDGALLVRIGSLSLQLEKSTSLHIYRAPYGAVVELNSGSILYTTPGGAQNLVIVASDVRVIPSLSNADFGRVSLDDPCNVTVSSQKGEANVQVGSEHRTVEQGKTYRVHAENQISYHKYLSPDADHYHDYHEHIPCAPLTLTQGHAPIAAGQSRFLLVTGVLAGTGTGIAIYKALESPDRP